MVCVCACLHRSVCFCSRPWNSFETKPHPLPWKLQSDSSSVCVCLRVCCLFRDCHSSQHHSTPASVCRGMVIHSSHMQIVAVRLGRPWERIKPSGVGCASILLSSLPTIPLHHTTPASRFLPPCAVQPPKPPLTHLPLLPWADLQCLGCVGCWVKKWRAD